MFAIFGELSRVDTNRKGDTRLIVLYCFIFNFEFMIKTQNLIATNSSSGLIRFLFQA